MASAVSSKAVEDVRALLECGVSLERVLALRPYDLTEAQLHDIAKSWVASASATQSRRGSVDVAGAVLERSPSALDSPGFAEMMIEGLEADAPEELKDPLFFTLMTDPVVLSSGVVVDRKTALNEAGALRFHQCPFTREVLNPQVYPILFLKDRLLEFVRGRIGQIFVLVERALAPQGEEGPNLELAARACQIGCGFLREVGRATNAAEAERMHSLRLRILEMQHVEDAGPWMETFSELLAIAKYMQQPSEASLRAFELAAQKSFDMSEALMALAPPRVTELEGWLAALCQLATCARLQPAAATIVRVAQLLLASSKKGGDLARLAAARAAMYVALSRSPGSEAELSAFLMEEGITRQALDELFAARNELIVRSVSDRRSTDEYKQLGVLECTIAQAASLTVNCQWADQGWGHTKGRIIAKLVRGATVVASSDVFGVCMASGPRNTHVPASRTFTPADDLIARMLPGDSFVFEYLVGGGGGHELHIRQFRAGIERVASAPESEGAGASSVAFPPTWLAPLLGLSRQAWEVEYRDLDGDHIRFRLEEGRLIKYVNGRPHIGHDDHTGVVTRLRCTRHGGRIRLDDQKGWGGELPLDDGEELVGTIAALADSANVSHNIFAYDEDDSDLSEDDSSPDPLMD